MPRPRTLDMDDLLDVAERIVTDSGPAGLTLRALAEAAGVSNGSIYHAFSSKEELLARAWLRAARELLGVQHSAEMPGAAGAPDGVDAVVAVALAPLEFARQRPTGARMFFAQRRDQLFSDRLPDHVAGDLAAIQAEFTALLEQLATAVWQRDDRHAVEAIACCVVDLPSGLLRRQLLAGASPDPPTARRLEAAVRAVLAIPLPAPRSQSHISTR